MNIAIVAPVIRKISPNNSYGGIERIIISLALGAAKAGHYVTLYAPYGSDLCHDNIKIEFTTSEEVSGKQDLISQAETTLFKRIVSDQYNFDIIHTHIEPVIARIDNDRNYFQYITKPVVVTMHNLTYIDSNIQYYKSHPELHILNYIFISKDQMRPLDFLPNKSVIYNGIKLDELTFNSTPSNNQLAFLGRITPEKGILEAIQIAKAANKKLVIAAAIDDSQRKFYDEKIKPLIDGKSVVYIGEIGSQERDKLLRESEALLFPIQWHEPFGLVIIEAMATGTPVIANNIGSVSEIIEDTKNGFVVQNMNSIDDFTDKISQLNSIERIYCRESVLSRFTEKIMVDKYLKHYATIQYSIY